MPEGAPPMRTWRVRLDVVAARRLRHLGRARLRVNSLAAGASSASSTNPRARSASSASAVCQLVRAAHTHGNAAPKAIFIWGGEALAHSRTPVRPGLMVMDAPRARPSARHFEMRQHRQASLLAERHAQTEQVRIRHGSPPFRRLRAARDPLVSLRSPQDDGPGGVGLRAAALRDGDMARQFGASSPGRHARRARPRSSPDATQGCASSLCRTTASGTRRRREQFSNVQSGVACDPRRRHHEVGARASHRVDRHARWEVCSTA